MAICSCSSWSERPSNWSIGCGEEEEEAEEGDEQEGERIDTPKKGKPVDELWRGQEQFFFLLLNNIAKKAVFQLCKRIVKR